MHRSDLGNSTKVIEHLAYFDIERFDEFSTTTKLGERKAGKFVLTSNVLLFLPKDYFYP